MFQVQSKYPSYLFSLDTDSVQENIGGQHTQRALWRFTGFNVASQQFTSPKSVCVCGGGGSGWWAVKGEWQGSCRVWHYSSHAPCSVSCAPCHVVMLSEVGSPEMGLEMGRRMRGVEDTSCRMRTRMWPGLMQNAYRFVGSRRRQRGKYLRWHN